MKCFSPIWSLICVLSMGSDCKEQSDFEGVEECLVFKEPLDTESLVFRAAEEGFGGS